MIDKNIINVHLQIQVPKCVLIDTQKLRLYNKILQKYYKLIKGVIRKLLRQLLLIFWGKINH